MNWQQYYNERLLTAQEAVNKIKSGDRVVVGHACGEPSALLEAMVANKDAYENVETVHLVGMGKSEYTQPGTEKNFRHNSLFVGANDRKGVAEGRADFTPIYFYRVPALFRSGTFPIDVALVQISPPDSHGYSSLGISVDYTKEAIKQGKTVIAQVNPKMPRCHGDAFVHVTEIDWFVELERDIVSLAPGPITAVEEAIGGHCASQIGRAHV